MKRFAIGLAVVLVAAWVAFVWPTPYRFYDYNTGNGGIVVMRVNRFTGATSLLVPGRGWFTPTPAGESPRGISIASVRHSAARSRTGDGDAGMTPLVFPSSGRRRRRGSRTGL